MSGGRLTMRLLCFLACSLVCFAQSTGGNARLVTTDIDNFWKAYDAGRPGAREEAFQKLYFDAASPGLQDFIKSRIQSAAALAATVDRCSKFYASVRANTLKVESQKPAILESLARFQELYPEAKFPAVYFVIGRLSSGGTTGKSGVLIGTEVSSLGPDVETSEINPAFRRAMNPIERLPLIVIHELTHTQVQGNSQAKAKASWMGELLVAVLEEGAADFMTELVTGSTINAYQHEFADARREELFQRLARDRAAKPDDVSKWLYNYNQAKDEPADLGYWLGAEICRDYYGKTQDKHAAVHEIVTMKNPDAIVRGSQYAWLLEP